MHPRHEGLPPDLGDHGLLSVDPCLTDEATFERRAQEARVDERLAHGESTAGPNKGPVYTHHEASTSLKISKPGTLHALALCNIHGLWESSKEISLS